MSKLRSFLIKVCSLILGVCATVGVLTMANASSVSAADPLFMIYDAGSIRLNVGTQGENYSGLRFRVYVNAEWYVSQGIDGATFGTLIYPAKNGTVDTNKSSTENMNALDGNNVIWKYYTGQAFIDSSIVFDDIIILKAIAEKYNEKLGTSYTYESPEVTSKLESVKAEIYAMEFTAYPYAIANGKTYWATSSYTTSMQKVAARTLVSIKDGNTADEDGTIKQASLSYVGSWNEVYYDGYASIKDNKVVIDGIDGYQVSDDAIVALGNDNATVENGEIILNGQYTASRTPQKLYIFEEGTLKVVDLLLVDNVLNTAEEVRDFFDKTTWAEDANHYNEITVLGSDVDMSTVEGSYGISTSIAFSGYFDGRGHVISNFTKDTNTSSNSIFGDLANSTVIKNVAFDNFTSIGYNVNNGWFAYNLRGTVENIYVKFSLASESQQMIMYTTAGHLNNVIIEVPYDDDLDVDAKALSMAGHWGRTLLARTIGSSATNNMNNVHVISQLPLIVHGTSSSYKEPTYDENGDIKWNTWFAYGENETKVWYDFDYFHTVTDDATPPGLGLEAGTQTVENTQVIVNGQSMKQGVTRVWNGVKRYDTLEEMVSANPEDVQAFVNSGMWKFENGKLLWANSKNVTNYILGDYDASQNALISTALNGEVVKKVTVNGVELSLDNEEYTVDENGYLTGIYAKTSDSDPKNGISYKVNSANNDILDEVVIYTQNGAYVLNDVNYYTRIIDSAAELKGELEKIDYTVVDSEVLTRQSGNGVLYSIANYSITSSNVTTNYVKEVAFNVGIYKLGANIDMYDSETGEYITIEYPTMTFTETNYYGYQELTVSHVVGGFTGTFDGAGYVIDNFKPTKYGMFGVLGTTGSGLTKGADIKNVAFTNVLTQSISSGATVYPVIAAYMYGSETVAQNISDIYVTYSKKATDMYGLIATPTVKLYMKNVYVVNETMYNGISADRLDQFYGVTFDANKQYRHIFTAAVNSDKYERTSVLFSSIRKLTNISTTYINNVLVASPNLLSYNYNFDFAAQSIVTVNNVSRNYVFTSHFYSRITCSYRNEAYYYCSNCGYYYASASCTRCGENAVLGAVQAKKTSSKSRGFAFAGNETTASVPVIKGFAPSIVEDLATAPYKDDNGNLVNPFASLSGFNKPGYVCDTCDAKQISLINGRDCTAEGCEGKMSVQATVANGLSYNDYNCVWASPMAYEWTLYDLTARSQTATFADTNAIVRLMGVTRYDTVAEINANADLSSFKKNKVWTIAEDGSLNWTAIYNAQA